MALVRNTSFSEKIVTDDWTLATAAESDTTLSFSVVVNGEELHLEMDRNNVDDLRLMVTHMIAYLERLNPKPKRTYGGRGKKK